VQCWVTPNTCSERTHHGHLRHARLWG
jgi:hypothetical protein